MNIISPYAQLLRRTLIALAVCAGLVTLCYFFVDRQVVFFVHDHRFNRFVVLKWLTYPPPIVQAWVPALLAVLLVRRAWGQRHGEKQWKRWELALVAAGVAMVLADQFRESLAYVAGRYWPETWIDNNPSLIGTGTYGFAPLQNVGGDGSFPSGHMARTVSVVAVLWIAWPRWRWLGVTVSLAVAGGLLGMDYHFVGDCIAGSFLGTIVGVWTVYCCGLGEPNIPVRDGPAL